MADLKLDNLPLEIIHIILAELATPDLSLPEEKSGFSYEWLARRRMHRADCISSFLGPLRLAQVCRSLREIALPIFWRDSTWTFGERSEEIYTLLPGLPGEESPTRAARSAKMMAAKEETPAHLPRISYIPWLQSTGMRYLNAFMDQPNLRYHFHLWRFSRTDHYFTDDDDSVWPGKPLPAHLQSQIQRLTLTHSMVVLWSCLVDSAARTTPDSPKPDDPTAWEPYVVKSLQRFLEHDPKSWSTQIPPCFHPVYSASFHLPSLRTLTIHLGQWATAPLWRVGDCDFHRIWWVRDPGVPMVLSDAYLREVAPRWLDALWNASSSSSSGPCSLERVEVVRVFDDDYDEMLANIRIFRGSIPVPVALDETSPVFLSTVRVESEGKEAPMWECMPMPDIIDRVRQFDRSVETVLGEEIARRRRAGGGRVIE